MSFSENYLKGKNISFTYLLISYSNVSIFAFISLIFNWQKRHFKISIHFNRAPSHIIFGGRSALCTIYTILVSLQKYLNWTLIQFIDFIEKYSFENYLGKNDFWKKGGGKVKFYKGQKKPDLSVTPEDAKSYIVRLVHVTPTYKNEYKNAHIKAQWKFKTPQRRLD